MSWGQCLEERQAGFLSNLPLQLSVSETRVFNIGIAVPLLGEVNAETLVKMLCVTCIALLLWVVTWVVSMLF